MSEMNQPSFSNELSKLFKEGKKYLEKRYDLARLDMVEKLVVITSFMVTTFILISLLLFTLFFLSLSLAYFMGSIWRNPYLGFIAVGGIYLLLCSVLFYFRRKLITQPILRRVIRLLFVSKKNDQA